jgi:hypothetical protein
VIISVSEEMDAQRTCKAIISPHSTCQAQTVGR